MGDGNIDFGGIFMTMALAHVITPIIEWCEQQVHVDIGDSLCKAYLTERKRGNREATSILLKLSDDLKRVDFTEAFVNPFDVSNKALECLMFKSGIDVCCQSDQERKFLEDSLKDV